MMSVYVLSCSRVLFLLKPINVCILCQDDGSLACWVSIVSEIKIEIEFKDNQILYNTVFYCDILTYREIKI